MNKNYRPLSGSASQQRRSTGVPPAWSLDVPTAPVGELAVYFADRSAVAVRGVVHISCDRGRNRLRPFSTMAPGSKPLATRTLFHCIAAK